MKISFIIFSIICNLQAFSFLKSQSLDDQRADSIKANDYNVILFLGYQFFEPELHDLYGFYPVIGGSINLHKSKLVHIPLELLLYYTNWDHEHVVVPKISSGIKFIPGTRNFNIFFQGGIGIAPTIMFPFDIHVGMGGSFHHIQIEFRENFYLEFGEGLKQWPMLTIILGIQL